ncbi:hypothetical protein FS749_012739 [Ceratobasidium sp. UAMH 11750]|nr:hypothetical protein FS749_012739 [Ceratobasidium sp. UAMH 11750]
MTSHRTQDKVLYVELPPFDPSETGIRHRSGHTRRREAEDSGAEDSQGNDIIDLPSYNPFAATGRESPRAKSFRGEREDSRGDNVAHLTSVNPFAASSRESRVKSTSRRGRNASESEQDEDDRDDGVPVLSGSNPFAVTGRESRAKAAPRRGRNASGSERDEEDDRDDGVTVLSSDNPFAERERGSATGCRSNGAGGHRGEVIVDLSSYDPSTHRGGRVPAPGRRDDYERRGGSEEDMDNIIDEDKDGVVTLSDVNPFAARRL